MAIALVDPGDGHDDSWRLPWPTLATVMTTHGDCPGRPWRLRWAARVIVMTDHGDGQDASGSSPGATRAGWKAHQADDATPIGPVAGTPTACPIPGHPRRPVSSRRSTSPRRCPLSMRSRSRKQATRRSRRTVATGYRRGHRRPVTFSNMLRGLAVRRGPPRCVLRTCGRRPEGRRSDSPPARRLRLEETMRTAAIHGIAEGEVILPVREAFRYRAASLRSCLRLCDFCLRSARSCGDSCRRGSGRSWKRRRASQRRRPR
jgi:hypothetical protein